MCGKPSPGGWPVAERMMKALLTCILVALFTSGCAMYGVRLSGREYPADSGMHDTRLYPATMYDARLIAFPVTGYLDVNAQAYSPTPHSRYGGRVDGRDCCLGMAVMTTVPVVGLIDLPFSLVTDTVMLPLDIAGRGRVRGQAPAPAQRDREFILTIGQANTNVPNTILVSGSGYPNPQATFRILPAGETVTVKPGEEFCSGDPKSTFRLLYAFPESAVLLKLPENGKAKSAPTGVGRDGPPGY